MDIQKKKNDSNDTLKMAIAMALFKSKLLQSQKSQSRSATNANDNSAGAVSLSDASAPLPNNSQSDDALKWKRKAKDRKREILRLQEDLKVAEDGLTYDVFPKNASCKCYFFDNMAELSTGKLESNSDWRFNDVLRRRFLRQVRIHERRRRRNGTTTQELTFGTNSDNEMEQLTASVDFLVELCETVSPVSMEDKKFKNWSHQAVDFILTTLKGCSTIGNNVELIEGIINSLIMRLLRRMCNASTGDESDQFDTPAEFYIQHLIRRLGREPYIGQRVILSVSHRISTAAESLLFMDPFDDAFPNMHNCMYIMIQVIEFLVSDHLLNWLTREDFDVALLEQWVTSILHAKKALELLENRNGLYALYIDRVVGDAAKRVGQSSFLLELNPNIRSCLSS